MQNEFNKEEIDAMYAAFEAEISESKISVETYIRRLIE